MIWQIVPAIIWGGPIAFCAIAAAPSLFSARYRSFLGKQLLG